MHKYENAYKNNNTRKLCTTKDFTIKECRDSRNKWNYKYARSEGERKKEKNWIKF